MVVALALVGYAAALPARAAATRVALIQTTGGDARAAQIMSLAEVLLAQQEDVQIVERQQIDRLLEEQHISLSGAIDAERAIKVGHVVSADVLAGVETSPGSPAIGLVVFDAATGVRLCDQTIAAPRDEDSAGQISRAISEGISKRQHVNTLRTVCLLSARNADLPRGMDGFCDAVGRLLERNLVRSDGVALLERRRLEQVTRERALSEEASRRQLLASVIVINLDVARYEKGLAGTALLSDAAGKSLGKVTATATAGDAASLAAQLAELVDREAKLPHAAVPLDTSAEAARFGAEAELRIAHSDFLRATPAAEAAHALEASNLRYHALLAQALIDAAKMVDYGSPIGLLADEPAAPLPDQVPAMANHGAQTLADVGAHYDSADAKTRASVDPILADATEQLCDYIDWAFVSRRQTTPLQQPAEFVQIRTALRQYLLRADAREVGFVHDTATFQTYSVHFTQLLSDLQWMTAQSSDEWTADFAGLVNRWLAMYDHYADSSSAQVRDALQAVSIDWALERHRHVRVLDDQQRLLRWDLTPLDVERLTATAKVLGSRPDETTKRYARLALLTIAVARAQSSPNDMYRLVNAYIEEIEGRLASPELKDRLDARRLEYHLAYLADALLEKTPYVRRCGNAILDFMLARHEFYRPFLEGISARRYRPIQDPAEQAAAIEREKRIIALIDSPGFVNLSNKSIADLRTTSLGNLRMLEHPRGVPAENVATTRPWTSKRTLVDVYDSLDGLEWLLSPVVQNGTVFAAGVDRVGANGPATLRLISIPLDGSPLRAGRQLPVTLHNIKSDPRKNIHVSNHVQVVSGTCIFEDLYCVGTQQEGIFVFPLDGSPPTVIDENHGLPTSSVRCVAGLDGVLYAGLGGGYLVAYDLRSKQADVLAASRRQEKRSPLDDGAPFDVRGLVPDPLHHRILTVIFVQDPDSKLSGVWEFKPAAAAGQQWRLLAPMLPRPRPKIASPTVTFFSNPIMYVGPLSGPRFLIGLDFAGLYAFDTGGDRIECLYHTRIRDFGSAAADDMPRYPGETQPGEAALLRRLIGNSLCAIDGEWLWDKNTTFRFGNDNLLNWGRTHLKTGQRQLFGSPRENNALFDVEVIQPLGDDSVLVGDQLGLWVINMSPTKSTQLAAPALLKVQQPAASARPSNPMAGRLDQLIDQLDNPDSAIRDVARLNTLNLTGEAYEPVKAALARADLPPAVRLVLQKAEPRLKARARMLPQQQKDAQWAQQSAHVEWDNRGHKDPRWDALVEQGMEQINSLGVTTRGSAYQTFNKAIAAGCDDALVLFLDAREVADQPNANADDVREKLRAAANAMLASNYGAVRKMQAVAKYLQYGKDLPPDISEDELFKWTIEASKDPDVPRLEIWNAIYQLSPKLCAKYGWKGDFNRINPVFQQAFASQWYAPYFKGVFDVYWAWDARGSGDASTVTPEGWKLFGQRIDDAARALEEAWKLDPTQSAIAEQMVTACMARSDPQGIELWYRRGIEANPDDYQLCQNKLYALSPRWLGSHEEMLAFGRECAATENHLGGIAQMIVNAHVTISQESGNPGQYMLQPQVWNDIHKVLEDRLLLYPTRHNRSRYVQWAAQCGHWDVVAVECQKLGDRPDRTVFPDLEAYKSLRAKARQQTQEQPAGN
jgi:hypothetical protein